MDDTVPPEKEFRGNCQIIYEQAINRWNQLKRRTVETSDEAAAYNQKIIEAKWGKEK